MDALEGLRDDHLYTQQLSTLGRPVARRTRAVLFAGDNDEGYAGLPIAHRSVVDRHLLAVGLIERPSALGAGRELVAQPRVGEGAAHHDLMVPAARAVGVEVRRLDPLLDQVPPSGAIGPDRSGR